MKVYNTDRAPAAIGPYSQAVSADGWLYLSGQIGLDPKSGKLVGPSTEEQTRQVLSNLREVLAAAGCTPADVLRATIYLLDMDDFDTVNELYGEFLGSHRPARSTVQAAALPKKARVEIDLVARLPGA
ncbi:MAG: RidA family protein [Thermoanaerobaculia bacterium]|nr:RidA family protein [Thermoanaerobaculia bacterium]